MTQAPIRAAGHPEIVPTVTIDMLPYGRTRLPHGRGSVNLRCYRINIALSVSAGIVAHTMIAMCSLKIVPAVKNAMLPYGRGSDNSVVPE